MKILSVIMVEFCFVLGMEKEYIFMKMVMCIRVNGNGIKSMDMVFIYMLMEKSELCCLVYFFVLVKNCKVDIE